ncbi:unnamed protein product, partial [Trichobilharzia regenti]
VFNFHVSFPDFFFKLKFFEIFFFKRNPNNYERRESIKPLGNVITREGEASKAGSPPSLKENINSDDLSNPGILKQTQRNGALEADEDTVEDIGKGGDRRKQVTSDT